MNEQLLKTLSLQEKTQKKLMRGGIHPPPPPLYVPGLIHVLSFHVRVLLIQSSPVHILSHAAEISTRLVS